MLKEIGNCFVLLECDEIPNVWLTEAVFYSYDAFVTYFKENREKDFIATLQEWYDDPEDLDPDKLKKTKNAVISGEIYKDVDTFNELAEPFFILDEDIDIIGL